VDLEGLSRLCIDPFSIDICLVFQETLVVELRSGQCHYSRFKIISLDIRIQNNIRKVQSAPYLQRILLILSGVKFVSESYLCKLVVA
jgi:hypothetical protein